MGKDTYDHDYDKGMMYNNREYIMGKMITRLMITND